jgi:hypothetical protein
MDGVMTNFKLEYVPDGENVDCGVDFNLSDADLDMDPDELIKRIFTPATQLLLDTVRKKLGKPTRHDLVMAEAKRVLGDDVYEASLYPERFAPMTDTGQLRRLTDG